MLAWAPGSLPNRHNQYTGFAREGARSLGRSLARGLAREGPRSRGASLARALTRERPRSRGAGPSLRSVLEPLARSASRSLGPSFAQPLARSDPRSLGLSLARSLRPLASLTPTRTFYLSSADTSHPPKALVIRNQLSSASYS